MSTKSKNEENFKKDILLEMQEIVSRFQDDPEDMHIEMDELLLRVLKFHGYEEVVSLFEQQLKWYA